MNGSLSHSGHAGRDFRLDVWRGLCIIDMMLVHLVHKGVPITATWWMWLAEYTRFAAGGFVLFSGLCVGAIHLRKAADPARRRSIYLKLIQRSFYILLVHYLATFAYLFLVPLSGEPLLDVPTLIRDTLLLRVGNDLLPFYVIMIALSPLLIEAVRRGGSVIVLAVSMILFQVGQTHFELVPLKIQDQFFVVLWQLPFVVGLLIGANLWRYDVMSSRRKDLVALAMFIAAVVIFVFAYGADFGWRMKTPFLFLKVPLSWAEVVRYMIVALCIATTTEALWRRVKPGLIEREIGRLGRRSLALAVFHIFVVIAVAHFANWIEAPPTTLVGWIALSLAIVWACAWMLERAGKAWSEWSRGAIRLEYVTVPATIGAMVVVLLAIQSTPRPMPNLPQLTEDYQSNDASDYTSNDDELAPDSASPLDNASSLDDDLSPVIMLT